MAGGTRDVFIRYILVKASPATVPTERVFCFSPLILAWPEWEMDGPVMCWGREEEREYQFHGWSVREGEGHSTHEINRGKKVGEGISR